MRKPKWDTELGRLLWLDGQTDGQIADALGIQISTVTAYRKRHWEKGEMKPAEKIGGGTEMPTLEKDDGQRHVFDDADAAEPGEPKNDRKELAMEEHRYDNTKPCTAPKNRYEVLEAATDGMTGIRAICTADAILCLWQWERPEDLKRAKAAIDYMLKKTEAQE